MTPPEHDLQNIVRYGVVAVAQREGRLLVIRRSQHVLAPGLYCFPGGGIEGDETEPQALVREMQEELNVTVRPRRRLWENVTSWRVWLAWWQVDLPDDAEPHPNPLEVESVHWHTPDEMARLPALLESNAEFLELLSRKQIVLRDTAE